MPGRDKFCAAGTTAGTVQRAGIFSPVGIIVRDMSHYFVSPGMLSTGHILLLPGNRDPHDGIGRITFNNFSTAGGHVTLYQIITFRHFSLPECINHSTTKHSTAGRIERNQTGQKQIHLWL
jgi:hypothetical protein